MLKWDLDYHDMDYVIFEADAQADEAEADDYPCPKCVTGTMRPGPWDEYGADLDGRRGAKFRVFRCCNCEYEEAGQ